MITANIELWNQFAHVGSEENDENIIMGCRNNMTFDSENLVVQSRDGKTKEQLCAIFFELTPQFIAELKAFVVAIEAHYADE